MTIFIIQAWPALAIFFVGAQYLIPPAQKKKSLTSLNIRIKLKTEVQYTVIPYYTIQLRTLQVIIGGIDELAV